MGGGSGVAEKEEKNLIHYHQADEGIENLLFLMKQFIPKALGNLFQRCAQVAVCAKSG